MAENKPNRFWSLVIIFLVIVIVSGGIVIWSKFTPEQPLEISISQPQGWPGKIYIDGAITKSGFFTRGAFYGIKQT